MAINPINGSKLGPHIIEPHHYNETITNIVDSECACVKIIGEPYPGPEPKHLGLIRHLRQANWTGLAIFRDMTLEPFVYEAFVSNQPTLSTAQTVIDRFKMLSGAFPELEDVYFEWALNERGIHPWFTDYGIRLFNLAEEAKIHLIFGNYSTGTPESSEHIVNYPMYARASEINALHPGLILGASHEYGTHYDRGNPNAPGRLMQTIPWNLNRFEDTIYQKHLIPNGWHNTKWVLTEFGTDPEWQGNAEDYWQQCEDADNFLRPNPHLVAITHYTENANEWQAFNTIGPVANYRYAHIKKVGAYRYQPTQSPPTPIPTPKPPTSVEPGIATVNAAGLNLRLFPDADSKRKALVPFGTDLLLTGKVEKSSDGVLWAQVEGISADLRDRKLWCAMSYLKNVKPR